MAGIQHRILVTAIGSMSAEAVFEGLSADKSVLVAACDGYPAKWTPLSKYVFRFRQVPFVATDKDAYYASLLNFCEEADLNFIMPLTDPEVDALSENREPFEKAGITLCIPSPESVKLCRDKLLWSQYLQGDASVRLIPLMDKALLQKADRHRYPMLAKPRRGRSSERIFRIRHEADLEYFFAAFPVDEYVIQPMLDGRVFVADIVRDAKTGDSVVMCREELLRTVNGAGITVRLVNDAALLEQGRHLADKLCINGCINIEFLYLDGQYFVMDINPRFSAGIGFSCLAGYNFPLNHLRCFTGDAILPAAQYEPLLMTQAYKKIVL